MNNELNAKTVKNSKRLLVIVVSIVALITTVTIVAVMYVRSNSPSRQFQHQLDLGYKYLEELNYEPAIAAFEAAIEIDPKNANPYYGLVDAYVGDGAPDGLLDVYELALDNLDNDDLEVVVDSISDGLVDLIESAISDEDYTEAYNCLSLLYTVDPKTAEKWFSRINELLGNSSPNGVCDDQTVDLSDPSEIVYSDNMYIYEELSYDAAIFEYSVFGVDWREWTIDSLFNTVESNLGAVKNPYDSSGTFYDVGNKTALIFREDSAGKSLSLYDSHYDLSISDAFGGYFFLTDADLAYPKDDPYARMFGCDKQFIDGHSLIGMNIYDVLNLLSPVAADTVLNNSSFDQKSIHYSGDGFIQYYYDTYAPGLYSDDKDIITCYIGFSDGYKLHLYAFLDTGTIYEVGMSLPG